jgi:hypothetical protein
LLEQGGTPSVSDSNDALNELNILWNAWSVDDGLIYAIQSQLFAWAASTSHYAIGPAATSPFNVPLPTIIKQAFWVTSAGRFMLRIVNSDEYHAHKDLAATAVAPDELYPDFNVSSSTGSANLYAWPVPSSSGNSLELETGAPFAAWTLAGVYDLSPGFQDLIQYALAWRLIPRYGMAIAQQQVSVIEQVAQKAEERFRKSVSANRQIPPPAPPPAPSLAQPATLTGR